MLPLEKVRTEALARHKAYTGEVFSEFCGYRNGEMVVKVQSRDFSEETEYQVMMEVALLAPVMRLDEGIWIGEAYYLGADLDRPNARGWSDAANHEDKKLCVVVQHVARNEGMQAFLVPYKKDLFGTRVHDLEGELSLDTEEAVQYRLGGLVCAMRMALFATEPSGTLEVNNYVAFMEEWGHEITVYEEHLAKVDS
jgi:hypothetical protein